MFDEPVVDIPVLKHTPIVDIRQQSHFCCLEGFVMIIVVFKVLLYFKHKYPPPVCVPQDSRDEKSVLPVSFSILLRLRPPGHTSTTSRS